MSCGGTHCDAITCKHGEVLVECNNARCGRGTHSILFPLNGFKVINDRDAAAASYDGGGDFMEGPASGKFTGQ